MKRYIKVISILVVLSLCLSLLAACGQNSGDQPGTNSQTPAVQSPAPQESETQPAETSTPTHPVSAPTDIADYLWDIPEGFSLEETAKLELRNGSLIQTMEPIFDAETYSAYSKAVTSLRSRVTQERLDAVIEAKAALVQKVSVEDGVYFIWNDFDSMPIADGESYTEEELDAASLLGYGYTTVLVKYMVDDPASAKGNIVIVSGGAMKGRSNVSEGYPAAEIFREMGYNCFLLQRRVEPYSTIDIYMDCQRAIRLVRYYAELEGWGGQDMIAACGWSGGGATILGTINHCYGDITPDAYDSDYVPDEIDAVSSDLDAALIIYGAINADGGELLDTNNENLPAFYINHGTADEMIPYTNAQKLYDLVSASVPAKLTFVEGAPHGYGVGTVSDSHPEGCSSWVYEADEFMQENLGHSQKTYSTRELCFYRDDLMIYGKLVLPDGDGPFPLVILSHGYGGNHTQTLAMAETLAGYGVAAYSFDYNGGGRNSLSEGAATDMSVLTEAADLNAVIDGLSGLPQIDASNIFLWGYSQGGFVSSYVAATRPEAVKALVAYFPAYVIHDDAKEAMPDPNNIPDEIDFMGMTIGRRYYEDALSFSIFDYMSNYPNDVIIFHGTKDTIAPIEYSQQAVQLFPSAELVVVEGKSHGNLGADIDAQAIEFILDHIG